MARRRVRDSVFVHLRVNRENREEKELCRNSGFHLLLALVKESLWNRHENQVVYVYVNKKSNCVCKHSDTEA